MEALPSKKYKFADFELDGSKRLLFKQGNPVSLNPRTFDVLLTLVENRGRVLTKDELLEKVWAGQFVEEGNLKVQVSTLRKIFGEKTGENRFIVTVPGRGYSFVAELEDNDSIVVESHRFSRILVEEFEEANGVVPSLIESKETRPSNFRWLKKNRLLALTLMVAVAFVAVGFVLWRAFGAKSREPFRPVSMRKLTSNGNVAGAALSPDGKLFAYSVTDGNHDSLWLGHVDGGEPVQLRPPAAVVYLSFRFDPDGSSLYYTSSENFGDGTLYRIPVFGGAPEKIRDHFRSLTFSPDGKRFAFIRSGENGAVLSIANASGADEREVPLSADLGSDCHAPAWSDDGSTIALAAATGPGETAVFAINVADGVTRRLTTHPFRIIAAMTWLPGSGGIAVAAVEKRAALAQLWYVSFPDGEIRRLTSDLNVYGWISAANGSLLTVQGIDQSNIWIAPADNMAGARQVTFGSLGQKDGWSGLAWTPDNRIIYTADSTGGTDLFVMNADGTNPKQVIPPGGVNTIPSVTADGRYLVFQSNRGGNYAVWRSDIDGSNLMQLTGSSGQAGEPYVSPDGKWVVYVTDADGDGDLWRVSIDGSDPVRLFAGAVTWPQISPDSNFIACGMGIDERMKLAILPADGGSPVKTFDLPRLANLRYGVHWMRDGKAVTYRDWGNGIWKQDLEGGPPERLGGLPEEKLFCYDWSRDGKQFSFTRGSSIRDVVLIENLPR